MEIEYRTSSLWDRFPNRQDIAYVFSGVVFIVYAWAVRGFFFQFSSLRLYHNLGDILAVFCYLMAFALLESLLILGILLLIGFILPRSWFRDGFAVKGFLAVLVAGSAMIKLQSYLYSQQINDYQMPSPTVISSGAGIGFILLLILIVLFQKVTWVRNLLLAFEERLQIFLYVFIPLGILGFIVVFLRNIR
ncbi:MAG: hypothetical protein QM730_19280 [Anaerolineales bacterium]